MTTPDERPRGGRETRLLLVTIAVSVGVLLLLARFRFPDEAATQTVPSAPAPLERLAARAVYDELASTMAEFERRILPRIAVIRFRGPAGETAVVAPRLMADRAVAVAEGSAMLQTGAGAGDLEIVGRDESRSLAVLRVPAVDDGIVTIRQGAPRIGPRYVAVVDASANGPIARPVYVARVETRSDANGRPTLLFAGLHQPLARGSAVFSLDGAFLGLVVTPGESTVIVPAETLPAAILNAQPATPAQPATLGIEVDALTPALARATGADHGVVVVRVRPGGPAAEALQSGDVIQAVDGTRVTSVAGFHQVERSRAPGATVSLTGARRRGPLEFTLRAAPADAPRGTPAGLGLAGRDVPGVGIEVVSVDEEGLAGTAGLSRGDLIVAIDGEPARSMTVLTRRFRDAAQGAGILLTVQRDHRHRVLALEKR